MKKFLHTSTHKSIPFEVPHSLQHIDKIYEAEDITPAGDILMLGRLMGEPASKRSLPFRRQ